MLNQIKIGKSAVETTTLGLGTNKVGGHNLFEGLEDQDGYEVVRTALDSNIKLLDTAYAYGYGRSEEIIGDVIKDYDRSNITIATKAAQDVNLDYNPNNDPEFLTQQIDHALKRLKTDYIDIFYIHFPDETTNKAEAIEALVKARDAGKIKAIGVSNFSLEQIKEANADDVIDVVEDHYSLVHRDAEKELIPYLNEHNITFVPYFPLASGILTGKYAKTDSGKFNQYSQAEFDQIIDAVEKVRGIAESKNATVAQVVLAWYLKNPNLGVVIPGARKAEQVKSNVKATAIELSDQEYRQIDAWFKF
ncbi:aldo/keto reductase [Pediococcus pentosaceus]|jgi:aryl-alcohol dehydrogenase-like predicted oxidoreductase|uniref:Aldo/keto reductase n=1 Tax=Pediococcus pentosaceus TaxID=1255 RepID=A0A6L5A2M9_PEDPE|nr:aldo/keto reductase [Pediococcus pentosaceus]KAF0414168.1 oxidoreductase [Pediococcus pentosaceus]KAF0503578.1 oxidoreductase [Pediococcus pentosaceus]MBF7120114.1 aldo/keto reductase [Pediococcus pentosaceus]MBF7126861.1 aldo/keto reductase [Pediococcus pentosaceus]MBU7002898.1 oxidoreductase [Pediococcus pentosaceus]